MKILGKGTRLAWDIFVRKSKVTTDGRNILSAPHNLCFLSRWWWQIFFLNKTLCCKKISWLHNYISEQAALKSFIFLQSEDKTSQWSSHNRVWWKKGDFLQRTETFHSVTQLICTGRGQTALPLGANRGRHTFCILECSRHFLSKSPRK